MEAGAQVGAAVAAGVVVFVVACAAMLSYGTRQYQGFIARLAREHLVDLESPTKP